MKLETKSKILTTGEPTEQRELLDKLSKSLAKSAEEFIRQHFERDVQLSSLMGAMQDQEAVRAIIRGLRVEVRNIEPLRFEASFKDDLAHWYDADTMPQDLQQKLQEVMNTGLAEWLRSDVPRRILGEVFAS